jgi:hypothetical protein
MLFEKTRQGRPQPAHPESARWVDGVVRGNPEVWVMVAPDEEAFDWLDPAECDEDQEEAAPYRVCRAILDDGTLVLADHPQPANDLLCELAGLELSELDLLDD